jgi:hypothetical protein|tara:strand:+ start:1480 stop:1887 length:408 start_codon:yes stop_codon:yes gene_type:complete
MDIIYFVIGILTTGVIYVIYQLRSVRSSHATILVRHQSHTSTTNSRYAELSAKIDYTSDQLKAIRDMMGKDKYQSANLMAKRLDTIDMSVNKGIIRQIEKDNETQKLLQSQANDLATVKRQIGQFQKDPNMINRY